MLRGWKPGRLEQRDEAREDAIGRDRVQLLMRDGTGKGLERRMALAPMQTARAGRGNQCGHHGIGLE